jgi:NAD(P)-dependent dehydrogenase (short-subunit alcohol dehydrogenase family)
MADKIVLITGGGRGIGLATAQRFVQSGWIAIIAEIDPNTGQEAVNALQLQGGRAAGFAVDVGKPAELEQLVATIVARYGGIHALVNNAFTPVLNDPNETSLEEWQRCIDVNLRAAWLGSRLVYPAMQQQGGGAILNVISTHAWETQPHFFPYNVAKGGLMALTSSLAVEYGKERIRVNAVAPGWIESVRTPDYFKTFTDADEARQRILSTVPLERMGRAAEVANAIYFLCSDEASYISGATLVVDGGRSVFEVNLSDLKKPVDRPYWAAHTYQRGEDENS